MVAELAAPHMASAQPALQRTVIITGAASGVGAATARLFAARGDHVVLCDLSPMDAVVDAIKAHDGKALAIQGDIAVRGHAQSIVSRALDASGRVDVLINNAAYAIGGTVETTSEEDFERTFAVNVKASFALSRAVIEPMRRARSGSILFTTAAAGHFGMANVLAYGASKAALIYMVRSMAVAHVGDGIRVNAVSPAGIRTPMLRKAAEIFGISDLAQLDASAPTGRVTEPEEVAELFHYLASPLARQINGHTVVIDGGLTAGFLVRR